MHESIRLGPDKGDKGCDELSIFHGRNYNKSFDYYTIKLLFILSHYRFLRPIKRMAAPMTIKMMPPTFTLPERPE